MEFISDDMYANLNTGDKLTMLRMQGATKMIVLGKNVSGKADIQMKARFARKEEPKVTLLIEKEKFPDVMRSNGKNYAEINPLLSRYGLEAKPPLNINGGKFVLNETTLNSAGSVQKTRRVTFTMYPTVVYCKKYENILSVGESEQTVGINAKTVGTVYQVEIEPFCEVLAWFTGKNLEITVVEETEGSGEVYVEKDKLVALKWEMPNMPTWSKSMDDIVYDLNRVLSKYEINTTERIRHFLAQCMKETNRGRWLREHDQFIDSKGWNDQQIKQNFETNYNYSYDFEYRGVGCIHLTFKYGYQAFATYLLKEKYPELNIKWGSPTNTGGAAIETNYNNAVNVAKNKGYNIKIYTDIVDIGTTHAAKNFAWDTAGYFWMSTKLNETVDKLKPNDSNEVDKVTAVVNKNDTAASYKDRRDFYREAMEIIK